jgi:hypothetical protein
MGLSDTILKNTLISADKLYSILQSGNVELTRSKKCKRRVAVIFLNPS